jgi:hypothetical protein
MLKHKDKQQLIERILNIPGKRVEGFWSREIKLIDQIYKEFPHDKFWKSFKLTSKLESLSFFKTKEGKERIAKGIKKFDVLSKYKPRKLPEITIGKKCGEDIKYNKTKQTIKQFLKDDRNTRKNK